MSREHHEHQPLLARMCELADTLFVKPAQRLQLASELSDVARRLESALLDHLEHEERTIIPAIAELLPPRTRESIVAQFAARRHVPSSR